MSAENESIQENVPYEDHIIPSTEGGAQGLSGFFDFASEIVKDSVGLVKEIGSEIADLGHELADMMENSITESQVPQEQQPEMSQEFENLTRHRLADRECSLDR